VTWCRPSSGRWKPIQKIYSHFFGLANEEFLQVIGVRANPKVIAALEAPAETVLPCAGSFGRGWRAPRVMAIP
jgi:hypothetical protein